MLINFILLPRWHTAKKMEPGLSCGKLSSLGFGSNKVSFHVWGLGVLQCFLFWGRQCSSPVRCCRWNLAELCREPGVIRSLQGGLDQVPGSRAPWQAAQTWCLLPCPLGEDLPQLPSEAGFEEGTGRYLGNDFSFGPLLQCPPHSFTSNNVIYMGFPGGAVKNPLPMQETQCSISGSGRSPGEGNGNPLQYSCLENPTDRGAWWATVYGAAKSQTWLSMHRRDSRGGALSPSRLSRMKNPQAGQCFYLNPLGLQVTGGYVLLPFEVIWKRKGKSMNQMLSLSYRLKDGVSLHLLRAWEYALHLEKVQSQNNVWKMIPLNRRFNQANSILALVLSNILV